MRRFSRLTDINSHKVVETRSTGKGENAKLGQPGKETRSTGKELELRNSVNRERKLGQPGKENGVLALLGLRPQPRERSKKRVFLLERKRKEQNHSIFDAKRRWRFKFKKLKLR